MKSRYHSGSSTLTMWKKLMVMLVIFGVTFFIVYSVVRSRPPAEEEPTSPMKGTEENEEVPATPPIIITGTTLRGWERGSLSWTLDAEEMRMNKQSTRATCPNGVELVVFDENGDTKATLTARKGFINLDNKDFQLVDTVKVLSSNGNRIETSGLIYRDRNKILEGFALSKIFFDQNYIECQSFISDLDFESPVFENIRHGSFIIGKKQVGE